MKWGMHVAVVAAWLVAVAGLARGEQASVLLEKGIYTQETLGDPSAAIPLFEQALADTQADRQVAAQAHFHLAMCHKALKQDAKARELLRQFVQRYDDQEVLVAKAKPILEELTEFDPATLMPPETLVYLEMGSPGAQLEKVLKMLEGTPFANPLTAIPTETQPNAGPPGAPPTPGGTYPGPGPSSPGQIVQAMLSPSMIKEFKKVRGVAMGIIAIGEHGPTEAVGVIRPGESDAIRGLMTALFVGIGQPAPPIEGMQVVQFEDQGACAFDDEVFILATPLSRLAWAVRQYKGATESSLATANTSFASLAPAASRRADALTVWADPARCLAAAQPMFGRGGMRDVMIISTLADVPNMEGVVGRLRLADNGATLEAIVAYKPAHRSLLYDLIRTPPMSGVAFAAVPPTAAVLAGVALQPPGALPEPSAAPDARSELVRHITGLDLGRELFDNIQEVAVFLDPGGTFASAELDTDFKVILVRSAGVVIVSRDPARTRAVLDRLLALPATFSATQPAQEPNAYTLFGSGRNSVAAYVGQEGHTTVVAFHPSVLNAALEALRSGRNVRTAGPLAKALAETQGDSKVVVVNVGAIMGLIDAANPPPPTAQATSAPTSGPATSSPLAQLAKVFGETTVRLETNEDDNTFTVRLTAADVPPMKDVFPLFMQLQQQRAAYRGRVVSVEARLAPQERNKLLRRAALEFLAALQKTDDAAIGALMIPGSPAEAKIKDIRAVPGLPTFQFQEMRRTGDLGWVLVYPDGADPAAAALLIHLHKQAPGGPAWLVTDVESLPVGQATGRIRDLAPNVVPVTRLSLLQGGTVQAEVEVEAGDQTPPKMLYPTATSFLSALGRRDQAAIKALILPGSPAEAKVGDLLSKVNFSSLYVRAVRRVGASGIALAVGEAPADGSPLRALVIRLVLTEQTPERDIWRVTDADYMPLEQAQSRMAEPLPQPSTQPAGASTGVRASPSGTFEMHVKGADLRDVLGILSTQAHKSIVATKEVTGTVTADLYGVTFPQALEAILKAQGFVYREKDGIISVYTPRQLEEVIRVERGGGRTKVVTEVLVPPTTGPSTQPAGARATVEAW